MFARSMFAKTVQLGPAIVSCTHPVHQKEPPHVTASGNHIG